MLTCRLSVVYIIFSVFSSAFLYGNSPTNDSIASLTALFEQIAQNPNDLLMGSEEFLLDQVESFSLDEADEDSEDVYDIEGLFSLSEAGIIDTTKVPAASLYPNWRHNAVNPYEFNILAWKDTARISLQNYHHPFLNRITSEFGFRRYRFHYGIDIKLNYGDSVRCAFDGMVRMVRYNRLGYGHYVVIRHFNGLETIYAHLSRPLVKVNQPIRSGEVLGLGGSTGRSTGSHLHFETRYLGQAFNPREIIEFDQGAIRQPDQQILLSLNTFGHIKEMAMTRYYVIRKGDTLSRIAMRNGVSINTLCKLNNISTKTILRIGQRLKISGL